MDLYDIDEEGIAKRTSASVGEVKTAIEGLVAKGLLSVDIDTKPRKRTRVTGKGWDTVDNCVMGPIIIDCSFEPELRCKIILLAEKRRIAFDVACLKFLKGGVRSLELYSGLVGEEKALDFILGS